MVQPPPPPPQPSSSRSEEGVRFGSSEPNVKMSPFVVCVNVLTTVVNILLGSVSFVVFYLAIFISDAILIMHVFLTIIGYMLLMSQVLLSYNLNTGFINNLKFPKKRTLHWCLQVIGSGLALVGCCMGIAAHAKFVDEGHLKSSHGIVGFIAMLLTAVSFVGGVMHLVKGKQMSTYRFEALYTIVFTLTLIFAYTAYIIRFTENKPDASTIMLICFSVIALILTLIMAYIDLLVRTGSIMF